MPIAARPADIDRAFGRANGDQPRTKSPRRACDLVRGFAAFAKGDEEVFDFCLTGRAVEQGSKRGLRLGFGERRGDVGQSAHDARPI